MAGAIAGALSVLFAGTGERRLIGHLARTRKVFMRVGENCVYDHWRRLWLELYSKVTSGMRTRTSFCCFWDPSEWTDMRAVNVTIKAVRLPLPDKKLQKSRKNLNRTQTYFLRPFLRSIVTFICSINLCYVKSLVTNEVESFATSILWTLLTPTVVCIDPLFMFHIKMWCFPSACMYIWDGCSQWNSVSVTNTLPSFFSLSDAKMETKSSLWTLADTWRLTYKEQLSKTNCSLLEN